MELDGFKQKKKKKSGKPLKVKTQKCPFTLKWKSPQNVRIQIEIIGTTKEL